MKKFYFIGALAISCVLAIGQVQANSWVKEAGEAIIRSAADDAAALAARRAAVEASERAAAQRLIALNAEKAAAARLQSATPTLSQGALPFRTSPELVASLKSTTQLSSRPQLTVFSSIPDNALVARGGNAANHTPAKIDAAIGPSRTEGVVGFSAQCNGGTCLAEVGANLRNNKLGVTTYGDIRAAGGDVIRTPGYGQHVTVTDLPGSTASKLLKEVPNPSPAR